MSRHVRIAVLALVVVALALLAGSGPWGPT
jgi:hypothetical protein